MLHTLPEDLLVQHILARLDSLTLRSCLSTCQHLKNTITSSPLLNYSINLQELNLIANPTVSYNDTPLEKRLELLREYRKRRCEIACKTRADVRTAGVIKGDAGVIYDAPYSKYGVKQLQWITLPSKEGQEIKCNEIHWPWNPSTRIVALALSIEENDLLACATWHGTNAPNIPWTGASDDVLSVQINLIQHSLQLPYPGLLSPILDICAFQFKRPSQYYSRLPAVNLAIRGTHLAVMVGHTLFEEEDFQSFRHSVPTWGGRLSIWNWKTGEKRCEKLNTPLLFLREDILLHGSLTNMVLDIYHLPTSQSSSIPSESDSAGDCEPLLIKRLGIPKVEHSVNLMMSFTNNSATIPSFTKSSSDSESDPKFPRLFTVDPDSSILSIRVVLQRQRRLNSFRLIIHHGTLLGIADRALSSSASGREDILKLKWTDWGPQVSRVLWSIPHYLSGIDVTCGSRLIRQLGSVIEVYDFGRRQTDSCTNTNAETQSGLQRPSSFVEEDDMPKSWRFEDVGCRTELPYSYETFKGSVDDMDTMYVDQSRIVGFIKHKHIDVLYIGGTR